MYLSPFCLILHQLRIKVKPKNRALGKYLLIKQSYGVIMGKSESDEKEVVTGSSPFQGIGIVTVSPIRGISANSSSKRFQSNPQNKIALSND